MVKRTNKEISVEFMLVCDYAYTAEGGKLSLVGKFETIFVDKLPANHPEMFLVVHLKGQENSEHNLRLEITNPSGKKMAPVNTPEVNIKLGDQGTGNFLHRMLNLPIEETGNYKIDLFENQQFVGKTAFRVIKVVGDGKRESTKDNLPN